MDVLAFLQGEDVNVFVLDWSAGSGITGNSNVNTVISGWYSNYNVYLYLEKRHKKKEEIKFKDNN